jgi:threonine aldolase
VLVETGQADLFLQALAREGVLATPGRAGFVRLCTHLDVGDEEIQVTIEAAARIGALERRR